MKYKTILRRRSKRPLDKSLSFGEAVGRAVLEQPRLTNIKRLWNAEVSGKRRAWKM